MYIKKIVKFDRNYFGNALKNLRNIKNMSMIDLANEIERTLQQVRRYEEVKGDDKQLPSISTLAKICSVLEVTPDYFYNIQIINLLDNPEPGVIYKYEIIKINKNIKKIIWQCPNISCHYENIILTATVFEDGKDWECDKCHFFYNKLHKE